MKKLLEAVNRGILTALNESNINLLADLGDDNLDQLDSIQTKSVNNKIQRYKYFPKTKRELVQIIKSEVERKGWNCSLNHIDVSQITDMAFLFSGFGVYSLGYDLGKFNGDISRWDVSNVKNMAHMFHYGSFNQHIRDWDVSNVTTMECMFNGARSFNQPIGDWDVSNVKYMPCMFQKAESFNQPIGDWDVSNVVNMHCMFDGAVSFNQPIGDWDVSNVITMEWMFCGAESFNQDLSNWKLKSICETTAIFDKCPIKEEYKPEIEIKE